MNRERGVCQTETGNTIVEDWTILFDNKTNLKGLQKCRNKRSKSILRRWNITETAEWRGKENASGGIMSKQQKGKSKYFVSFGVHKYPHQCSLPSEAPGKAPSNSPPTLCCTSPTLTACLPWKLRQLRSCSLHWKLHSQHQGWLWERWQGGQLSCDLFQPWVWHVPLPPCLRLPEQVHSKSYSNYPPVLLETKNCHPIPLLGRKVRESQKPFLMYNELPVNLQVQTFSVYKINTFSRFSGFSVTWLYHCLNDMFLPEKKSIQEVLWPLFCRKSGEVKMLVPVAISSLSIYLSRILTAKLFWCCKLSLLLKYSEVSCTACVWNFFIAFKQNALC